MSLEAPVFGSKTVSQVPVPEPKLVRCSAAHIITLPEGVSAAETGTRPRVVTGVQAEGAAGGTSANRPLLAAWQSHCTTAPPWSRDALLTFRQRPECTATTS